MRVLMIVVFVLFVHTHANAKQYTVIDGTPWVGCQEKETLQEITHYALDGDREAWKNASVMHIMQGMCITVSGGRHSASC